MCVEPLISGPTHALSAITVPRLLFPRPLEGVDASRTDGRVRGPSILAAVLLIALVSGACTVTRGEPVPPAESMAFAGFSDTTGVEVLDVFEESGIDTLVKFALQGTPEDIDRVLAAAEFTSPKTFAYSTPRPLAGFDLTTLTDSWFGGDEWENSSGRIIDRSVFRGTTPEGKDLIHVWAS